MRENFSQTTIRDLRDRAGNVCSFPGCHKPTSGPSDESDTQTSNTGVAAHICAASQGNGARRRLNISKFDVNLLSSIINGIWMCQTHAKLIDTDEVRFTVEMLQRWRELAELRARLNQEINSSVPIYLHRGNEVPLAIVNKSATQNSSDVLNEICNAVLDSCIVDIWGEELGYAIRDVVGELMSNAFRHGGARKFELDIQLNRVLIKSDDGPYNFGQLLNDSQCHGGQQAASALVKFRDRILTSYRREDNYNTLEISFITSSQQVLGTTVCSVDYNDFFTTLNSQSEWPEIYSNCETIYIVMSSKQHLIPSVARTLSIRLKELASAQKKIVLIGSAISEGVKSMLQDIFPDIQIMQI